VTSAALKTATSLNLVDNTPDASKPISTATQAAISALAVATTGDFKFVMRASAPAGWIAGDGSTIGNVGSGATRANADTQALFTLWWTDFTNAQAPILTSSGAASTRGASAAADWLAGKRLTVFDVRDEFVRNGSATNTVGTKQSQDVQPHTHGVTAVGGSGTGGTLGLIITASGAPQGTFATTSTGGAETRPRNVAMLGCFKL
jgi:hypothetical protein